MENNKREIDPKLIEKMIEERFGISNQTASEITITYDDLLKYTQFIVEIALTASIRQTDKLLEQQRKINNTINYN